MHWPLLAGLADELKLAQKQISELKSEVAKAQLPLLVSKAETTASGTKLLAVQVEGMDAKSLQVVNSQVPGKIPLCYPPMSVTVAKSPHAS